MLKELFTKYGSDKGENGYGEVYEELFHPYRDTVFNLLELGIWAGASMYAWRDYFPRATIIGVDNNAEPLELLPRMRVHRGDEQDKDFIDRLIYSYKEFTIIVDDAGHYWGPQQDAFKYLWPSLAPGGLYIIEDLATSFDHRYITNGYPHTVDAFCAKVPDLVKDVYRTEDIEYIQFRPNMVVVRKRP